MVIRLAAQDGLRAIELFDGQEPNHLMTERQGAQGEFLDALARTSEQP